MVQFPRNQVFESPNVFSVYRKSSNIKKRYQGGGGGGATFRDLLSGSLYREGIIMEDRGKGTRI